MSDITQYVLAGNIAQSLTKMSLSPRSDNDGEHLNDEMVQVLSFAQATCPALRSLSFDSEEAGAHVYLKLLENWPFLERVEVKWHFHDTTPDEDTVDTISR